MATVLGSIAAIVPSEFGGSTATNRFDYQMDWTLCHILSLQRKGGDFLVICDYHDDVIVLNGSENASQASFYQIKTSKSPHWTTTRLLSRKRSKDEKSAKLLPSPLGKLYKHRLDFPTVQCTLNFVSNHYFNVSLAAEPKAASREKFTCAEISEPDLKRMKSALKDEHSLAAEPDLGDYFTFIVSELQMTDHTAHAKGKLSEFLEAEFSGEAWPIAAMYKTFHGEIRKRVSYEYPCITEKELVEFKGISKAKLEQWLSEVVIEARARIEGRFLGEICSDLATESVPWKMRRELETAVRSYLVEKLDPSRTDLRMIAHEAKIFIESIKGTEPARLIDLLNLGVQHLRKYDAALGLSDVYLMAIVAMEVQGDGRNTPTITKKPPEAGS